MGWSENRICEQFLMIQNQVIYEAEEQYEHIICGAGLVGVLWALYLRRRSESIAIFEKTSDIRDQLVWGGRSINMLITRKALDALEQLGIKQFILEHTKQLRGKVIHQLDGKKVFLPYSPNPQEIAYCIQRKELSKLLLNIAESNNISVYFGYAFQSGNLEENKFVFKNEGNKIAIRGQYLYGADGAGSEVRKNMFKYNGGFTKAEWCDTHYKELFVPADQTGAYQLEEDWLHIWPRGQQLMMGMPNPNGSFSLTLLLPSYGQKSFQQLNNQDKMRDFLTLNFPDVFDLIPNPVEQIFSNPLGVLGSLSCSNWHFKNRCVLMGDAAHTILPFYSQAMNSGYFDCYVLDRLMDQYDYTEAFEKYAQSQRPQSDIMAKMASEHLEQLSSKMMDPRFLMEKEAELRLMKAFPEKYRSREKVILFGRESYQEAYLIGETNKGILKQLLKGVNSLEKLDLGLARKLIEKGPQEDRWKAMAPRRLIGDKRGMY